MSLRERTHVVRGGTAEVVDGLVRVTHDGHVARAAGEHVHELHLGRVHVLELVHQQVAIPGGHLFAKAGAVAQQL